MKKTIFNHFLGTILLALLISPFNLFSQINRKTVKQAPDKSGNIASIANDGFQIRNGVKYKFVHRSKSAKKPNQGDIITLSLKYSLIRTYGDTLLFDTKNMPQKSLMVSLNPPSFKGDIMEAFGLLEEGDTLNFIAPADSFFVRTAGMGQLPNFVTPNSELIFTASLMRYSTMEEYQLERAQMDSISMDQEKLDRRRYLLENRIKMKPRESGLIIVPITEGTGPKPSFGQKVTVHYTGYLLNGQKFDSSVDRKEPFSFTLGQGQVIKGWDEGIAELNAGAKAKLIIPSSIGYGSSGAGQSIPPFATLVFEVELIKAE